ncbi:hypothetical protein [Marinobacter sp. LV10MA510-1]|uniref:hypothetical protein n=1 Tax=Marinobacter sp. LV10MA510-1 TaxID=1415567 RepID=UPI000C010623|nr:hypothetical protein [Marinobacter sp. LV10MA510-1]PFG11424.1 hypothetical protein ATI45_3940 [Marinobacter sp. LV10MA510-1]
MPKSGLCKLCLDHKELKFSHAIGDSIFKKIYRKNSGKAISLTSDDDAISYSNDSWAEHQLCNDCETLLNLNYEAYSLGALRGIKVSVDKTSFGIKFSKIDQHRLILYFLSILWRAANSNHRSYKNVVVIDSDNEFLRNTILNNLKVPSSKFSIKISRVIDLTKSKGFSSESIKELILSPFCRIYETDKVNNVSVCFMFEGFFIEIFTPSLKLKNRNSAGILHKNKNILIAPYLDLFTIDEVVALMVNNYGKHLEGRSKIKSDKKINKD